MPREPRVGGIISSQRGSFSQHSAHNYLCLSHPALKKLTGFGGKDEETGCLDSVMSSDDYNVAIRVGSLEEEPFELQTSKVWGVSNHTRMGISDIPVLHLDLITTPSSKRGRETRGC